MIEAALKLPPKERSDFLDQACARDSALRARVVRAVFDARQQTGIESASGGVQGIAINSPEPSGRAPATPAATLMVTQFSDDPGERTGDVIGQYTLREKLGEGGMGSVWVAEERGALRRKVAIKLIKPGMDSKAVIARFENERRSLALMDHPHISKIFFAGTTAKDRPFFAMELVQGIRITDYCDRHKLPTRERLELFLQVCEAVEHAHQKGILHRDLKPPNILVTVQQGKPIPKIIDFGVAKAIGGQRLSENTIYTSAGEFIGTPAYMSPEQAEMDGLGIDARSDVYSLGVLLYELLTGLTPFDSDRLKTLGLEEIRRVIREEEPVPPSTRLATLDPGAREAVARQHQSGPPNLVQLVRAELDWIVMKCLEKDRTRRYASAAALAADVQHYLLNQPVTARPPTLGYRFRKWTRRNAQPLKFAAASALSAVLLSGLALAVWPKRGAPEHLTVDQWLDQTGQRLNEYDLEGRIPAAKRDLQEAMRDYPNDARVVARLAWANWLWFEDEESEESFYDAEHHATNALSLNPNNAEAHLVAGLVARSRRDWSAATNQLSLAVDRSRSNPLALICLASVCFAAGDLTNAFHYARRAEERPEGRWLVLDRAGILRLQAKRGGEDLAAAVRDFKQAVSLAPKSPLAHRHLGQALLLQRDTSSLDQAQAEFKKALDLRRNARTLGGVGSAFLAAHRFGMAEKFYRLAIEKDPSKYIYHLDLGLSLRMTDPSGDEANREFRQSLDRIENVLKAGPKPLVRAHQGLCLAALGDRDNANSALALAEREASGDKLVLEVIGNARRLLGNEKTQPNLSNHDHHPEP